MRHLHFVQSLEPLQGGGLGSAALQLHQELYRKGGSQILSTRSPDFVVSWPGVYQGVREGLNSLYYSSQLRRVAAEKVAESDWCHAHGLYVFTNFLCGFHSRSQGKPYAYHIHGFFDPWILSRSRWKKNIVKLIFEDRNLKKASFLRALTTKEEAQIRSVGLTNPVVVVPNGITLPDDNVGAAASTDCPFGHRKRPKRVLFLSRLHAKKGLDILLLCWSRLTARYPDWELAIVGPDEGGYKAILDRLIREYTLEDSCTILPPVFGRLKDEIYKSADLFVLPSYSEGFPMAVLEAAAHRLPVVLSTECNFPELQTAGGAWECLPEESGLESALSEALRAGDEERKQRGMLGRQLVEKFYTWEKVTDLLHSACESYA